MVSKSPPASYGTGLLPEESRDWEFRLDIGRWGGDEGEFLNEGYASEDEGLCGVVGMGGVEEGWWRWRN